MLIRKSPAALRPKMKENERWAGHITFLTITSALAAALIAAFAAIFADPDKIPDDTTARALILLAALFVISTLGLSLWASAGLSNYLILSDQMSYAERLKRGAKITFRAGAAFIILFISSVFMLAFLSWVAFFIEPAAPKKPRAPVRPAPDITLPKPSPPPLPERTPPQPIPPPPPEVTPPQPIPPPSPEVTPPQPIPPPSPER